jgi:hypothetical protein
MTELVTRIAAVLASSVGLFAITVALLTIAGILLWAFWKRNDTPMAYKVDDIPAKIAPPPLLAPEMFKGGAGVVEPRDNTLRNLLLGVVALMVVFVAVQFLTGGGDSPVGDNIADNVTWPDDAVGGPLTADDLPAPDYSRYACNEGPILPDPDDYVGPFAYEATSYRLCAPRQAAVFDVLNLTRDGADIVMPNWQSHSSRVLESASQAAPFTLDWERVDLKPGAGVTLRYYDAYLAIGMAGVDTADDSGRSKASDRGFAIARFIVDELRGGLAANDCAAGAQVYALSVGRYAGGGNVGAAEDVATAAATLRKLGRDAGVARVLEPVQPVLLGVRFDPQVPPADRDLDALVSDFMRSNGVEITGFNLRNFEPRQKLFVESACTGAFAL